MIHRFFKDTLIYGSTSVFGRALGILVLPLFTKLISPDDYGKLEMITIWGALLMVFVSLEISQGVARYYSGERDVELRVGYASSSLFFNLVGQAIFLTTVFTFSHRLALGLFDDSSTTELVKLGAVFVSSQSLFRLIQNQIRWNMQPLRYAFVTLLQAFFGIGISLYLVLVLKKGILGLLWGQTIGACIGICLGLFVSHDVYRFRYDWPLVKEMLAFSLPLVPAAIGTVASIYIDRMAIKELLTLEHVGLYSIAYRLATPASLLIVGFQMALTPLVYHNCQKPETPENLACIFRIFLCLGLPACFFAALFAEDIVKLLTAPRFHEVSRIFPILFASALTVGMYVFAPGMGIAKKTKILAVLAILGACMNGLLNFLLIPIMGLMGAAVGTLLGAFAMMLGWFYFSHRHYPIPFEWVRILTGIGWTALLVLLLAKLNLEDPIPLLGKTFIALFFLVTLFPMGLLKISELRLFFKYMRGIRAT